VDVDPFDDRYWQVRGRREVLETRIEAIEACRRTSTWAGPRSDRFREVDDKLLADLNDLVRRLGEIEVTLLELHRELEEDLAGARRVRDRFLEILPGDYDPVETSTWPVKPGYPPPEPGEPGYEMFREWAEAHPEVLS
jgi:hypothetical protein